MILQTEGGFEPLSFSRLGLFFTSYVRPSGLLYALGVLRPCVAISCGFCIQWCTPFIGWDGTTVEDTFVAWSSEAVAEGCGGIYGFATWTCACGANSAPYDAHALLSVGRFCGRARSGKSSIKKTFIRAQCRSHKVVLSSTCLHAASVFAVAKAEGRQREVWDGAELSLASQKPPHPVLLASPSDLCTLECSDGEPLVLSMRDGKSFFDQLAVVEGMRPWFGKPWITIKELCDDSICSEGPFATRALSREELLDSLVHSSVDTASVNMKLTPLANCCWAPAIA